MEADPYPPTMSNRMTLMDGDVPRKFPGEGAREQGTRFPIKVSAQASSHQKRDLESKHYTSGPKSVSPIPSKPHAVTAQNHNFTQVVRNKSRTSYHTFMPLDQAGPAVIAREDKEDGPFVAIKRVKRADRELVYRIPGFKNDHLVNIKDMFLECEDEIVIVYQQMDVSLRHIMAVTGGPLHSFEIAAICKEVSDV